MSEGSQYSPNQAIRTESDDFWPYTSSDRAGLSRLGGVIRRRCVPAGAELRWLGVGGVRVQIYEHLNLVFTLIFTAELLVNIVANWSALTPTPKHSLNAQFPLATLLCANAIAPGAPRQAPCTPASAQAHAHARARARGQDEGLCAQPVELARRCPHRRQPRFPRPGAKFAHIRRRVHSYASGPL